MLFSFFSEAQVNTKFIPLQVKLAAIGARTKAGLAGLGLVSDIEIFTI